MLSNELCRIFGVRGFAQRLTILSSPDLGDAVQVDPSIHTTAGISPVGIRYNSLPRASFRSSWLLACWYNKAATGITGQARGSHPSMSSQTVDLLIVIMGSVTHPILVQIKTIDV